MIRLVMILLWAVFAAGTAAADQPWTGEWEITWGNGGALVSLQQDGNSVGGSFGQGSIMGEAHGRQLDGHLTYNKQREGLTATLSEDGQSFAGTTESGDWLNGHRVIPDEMPSTELKAELGTPRAALRSFLVAISQAQSDKPYALSTALDAIAFGDDAGWQTREARFTGAQQLFQLIDRATFNMAMIPDDTTAASLALALPRLDDEAPITIDMQRNDQGEWQIVMPPPDKLRDALDSAKIPPADNFRTLQNPRDTLRTFLDGMQHWDNGGEQQAIDTIDLSRVPEVLRTAEGSTVAQYLVRIINRVGQKTLQNIPNSGTDRQPFVYFELPAGRIVIEPVGTGKDTRWKFSPETALDIRRFYRSAELLPDNNALDASYIPASGMFMLRDYVKRFAPSLLGNVTGPGHVEYWQLLSSILSFVVILAGTLLIRSILLWLMNRQVMKGHVPHPERLALALGLVIAFVMGSRFVAMIGMPAETRQYTLPTLGTALIFVMAYAAWQIVAVILSFLQEFAAKTETSVDNILLTFAAGLARMSIAAGAVLLLSWLWSLPTSGLIAGLGISGLAVAFASKETISNVFGAGILLGDRPFGKGDRIIAGDVNGWVESVGLRSTRVRTLYDSVLVVPNGKLADMVVNNLGARRKRSMSATVIVTAGATPESMEAFTRDIRQRIADDPIFEGKWAEVNISRMWWEGIDVEISSMIETRSGRASREAQHKLYLDILRIAEANGLTLAHATDPNGSAGGPATAEP